MIFWNKAFQIITIELCLQVISFDRSFIEESRLMNRSAGICVARIIGQRKERGETTLNLQLLIVRMLICLYSQSLSFAVASCTKEKKKTSTVSVHHFFETILCIVISRKVIIICEFAINMHTNTHHTFFYSEKKKAHRFLT